MKDGRGRKGEGKWNGKEDNRNRKDGLEREGEIGEQQGRKELENEGRNWGWKEGAEGGKEG